jgi:hypothetical protein
LTVDATPRSVDYLNDKYLVGMANGSIVEYDRHKNKEILIQSHNSGELWGLSILHEEGTHRFITSGDDN